MARPTLINSNTTELSLLLSIVFYCNSLVIICENYLSQTLTMLVTLESLTCIFLSTLHLLKMSKSYQSLYWDFFFSMSMYLVTCGDSTKWSFFTGCAAMLLGFTFLCLDKLWRSWKPRREEKNVTFLVKVGVLFMGNGVAIIMGRFLLPNEEMVWTFVAGGFMFCVSGGLFCYYYLHSAYETETENNLEVE